MQVEFELDTTHINRMFVELERRMKVSLKDVLHAQTSSIVKQCAIWSGQNKNTKQRTHKDAIKYTTQKAWKRHVGNFKADADGKIAIRVSAKNGKGSSGWRYSVGSVFFKFPSIKKGKNSPTGLMYMGQMKRYTENLPVNGNRTSLKIWSEFLEAWQDAIASFKTTLSRKIPNIGFTRKTWIQVLLSLGWSFEEIQTISPKKKVKINDANTFVRGVKRKFGFSYKRDMGNVYSITIVNTSDVAVRADSGVLVRAINSNRKAFESALRNGVFDSAKEVEKRYGWIKVIR